MDDKNRFLQLTQVNAYYHRKDGEKLDKKQQDVLRVTVTDSFRGMIQSLLHPEEIDRLPRNPRLTIFDWGGSNARISRIKGWDHGLYINGHICEGTPPEPRDILRQIKPNSCELVISRGLPDGTWLSYIHESNDQGTETYVQISMPEINTKSLKLHLAGAKKGKVEYGVGVTPLYFMDILEAKFGNRVPLERLRAEDSEQVENLGQLLRSLIFSLDDAEN